MANIHGLNRNDNEQPGGRGGFGQQQQNPLMGGLGGAGNPMPAET